MSSLLYNGWKDKANRHCIYCGKPYAERHEVFGGSNRQNSILLGLQIDVCREHHKELQDNCTDWAQSENARLREKFEREYIANMVEAGFPEKIGLAEWMHIIGKNYCDDMQPE